MKNILIIGAGRTSLYLVKYFLDLSEKEDWKIILADKSLESAELKIKNHPRGEAVILDILDVEKRNEYIKNADIVVSMLPASLHYSIAKECIYHKKNMITASYVSKEMRKLDKEARNKNVLIMNEIGLDPGLDHLSAMYEIDKILEKGGEIVHLETFCGGLIAKPYDNNPWQYKFTWNPRNVVVAGQNGIAKYKEEGTYKYVTYNHLFKRIRYFNIEKYGEFEGYPNRNSLSYDNAYGLQNSKTILRGTLRRKGFCKAWDILVNIGILDDTYIIENSSELTYREFINLYLPFNKEKKVELKVQEIFNIDKNSDEFKKLNWLGIFDFKKIELERATPAQITQDLLEKKWKLESFDKDMIVMIHKFGYKINKENKQIQSSMVLVGEDDNYTAMSKTVGLPVAICTKMILQNKINKVGVCIPLEKEIYIPILNELKTYGISF